MEDKNIRSPYVTPGVTHHQTSESIIPAEKPSERNLSTKEILEECLPLWVVVGITGDHLLPPTVLNSTSFSDVTGLVMALLSSPG